MKRNGRVVPLDSRGSDVVDSKRLMCGTRRLGQCSGMSPEQTAQVRRPALPRAFGFV